MRGQTAGAFFAINTGPFSNMNYHIARGETRLGVWTHEDLLEKHRRGEILPTDLIWHQGMPEWISFAQWIEKSGAVPAPEASAGGGLAPALPSGDFSAGPGGATGAPPKPSNYLVPAILVTLFCCLPFGIAAIIFAAQVDGKHAAGDFAGAQKSSDNAKMWTWIAFGVGLVMGLFWFVMIAMGALAEAL